MRTFTAILAVAAACAGAAVAGDAPVRLTDVQFIAANRCLGLESSKTFNSPDAEALRQLVKGQEGGRAPYISDRADQARDDGQREANLSGAAKDTRLAAERDGVCRQLATLTTASTGGGAHTMIQ
jgi:hypothetical protein